MLNKPLDKPAQFAYSITSNKSFASTLSPTLASFFVTFPSRGAYTVDCIFIASSTRSRSPFFTCSPTCHDDAGDRSGNRRAHLPWFGGIGFRPRLNGGAQSVVADLRFARLPVQLEKRACAYRSGCGSLTVSNFTTSVFPGSSSIAISWARSNP